MPQELESHKTYKHTASGGCVFCFLQWKKGLKLQVQFCALQEAEDSEALIYL